MSDTKRFDKEILSAWVDGRSDDTSREQSLEQGSESMAVWSRYQLIGQVMRNEVEQMDLDISGKVSEAIAKEETYGAVAGEGVDETKSNVIPFPNRVWKQAGGFAIAASVAIVALFSVSNTQPATQFQQQVSTVNSTSSVNPVQASEASIASRGAAIGSNVERQELQTMHDMFVKHEALTRQMTGMSSLPSVRVVSNQKLIPVQVPMRVEERRVEEQRQDAPTNSQNSTDNNQE